MSKLPCLILAILLSSCKVEDGASRFATICYIPIGIETYTPVTLGDIEDRCNISGSLRVSAKQFDWLARVLATTPEGPFNDHAVRVKLTLVDGQIFYFDNYGGIKVSDQSDLRIGPRKLRAAGRFLKELALSADKPH